MSRKEAIVEAATLLFAEKGFEATPTAEVAKAAGVAEGTIFHHFKSKDGILIHVFHDVMKKYIYGLEAESQLARNGLDALRRMLRFHFYFIDQYSKEALVMCRALPFHFLKSDFPQRDQVIDQLLCAVRVFQASIELGQRDGSIRDFSPEKAAFILRGLLVGLSRQKLVGVLSAPELSEEAIDFCCCGLARNFEGSAGPSVNPVDKHRFPAS